MVQVLNLPLPSTAVIVSLWLTGNSTSRSFRMKSQLWAGHVVVPHMLEITNYLDKPNVTGVMFPYGYNLTSMHTQHLHQLLSLCDFWPNSELRYVYTPAHSRCRPTKSAGGSRAGKWLQRVRHVSSSLNASLGLGRLPWRHWSSQVTISWLMGTTCYNPSQEYWSIRFN